MSGWGPGPSPAGCSSPPAAGRGGGADAWPKVIAGDAHYVKRFMPERMDGKIIVTNTTTEQDTLLFRAAGVHYMVTSTPVLDGRSFGTNMMEAALTAVAGLGRLLQPEELGAMLDRLRMEPQRHQLN